MRVLRQGTAATIIVGLFIDWSDAKTPLSDNDAFDPTDLACELIKGAVSADLTLAKTGGDNNINLTGKGQATLTITAANVDTLGRLRISFTNKVTGGISSDLILAFCEDFTVLSKEAYDRMHGELTSRVQDKTTLEITHYAADGVTPILVESVTEDENTIEVSKADPV
jgi:hypothetical protein